MKIFSAVIALALSGLTPIGAQTGSNDAGAVSCPAPTTAAPIWAKLVISGNIVTCSYAKSVSTPTTWTQLGQPQTINFIDNPILVGVYITAHNGGALSSGTLDNLSITPKPAYMLQDQDVGAPVLMGCANLMSGVWSLSGSGADIWGTTDQFNFQPWLVWGDATIICRITSISTAGDAWQKIGIMVRDGYNSGSDYALFCASAASGVDFQYRTSFNDNGDTIKYIAPPTPGVASGTAVGMGITGTFQGPYVLHP